MYTEAPLLVCKLCLKAVLNDEEIDVLLFFTVMMSQLMNIPLFRLNPLAAGLNLNPGLKADASNKEIEEAMKRVREAQSLISAAIEPGSEWIKVGGTRC